MSIAEIFGWGAVGGLLYYALEFVRLLRTSDIEVALGWGRLVGFVLVAVANCLLGGTLSVLVDSGSADLNPLAAAIIGYAMLPAFTGLMSVSVGMERDLAGDDIEPPPKAPSAVESGSSQAIGRIKDAMQAFWGWWTASRVQALMSVAAFILALVGIRSGS